MTTAQSSDGDDRQATAELLARTHPDADRFADTTWLDWLYDGNPVGSAVEKKRDRRGERIGHVGLVPQRWRRGDTTGVFLSTVNAVTAAGSGRALFSGLVARAVRDGATIPDARAGYGVTNDASSVPALQRLQARLVCSLPIMVALPSPPVGVGTMTVTPAALDGAAFARLVGDLTARSTVDWTQHWSLETLRWRLAAPGVPYAVHWTDDLVAVSARTRARGVRLGVLMKVIPRHGPVSASQVRRVVGAIHRTHRVPAVVYAGFNRLAPVSGLSIPERMRPAPANLFVIGGDTAAHLLADPELQDRGVDAAELVFEAFELLDFDPL